MLHLRRQQIFTHRGLEPTKSDFFPESSYEAFADHLKRGFGIEFDPNFARDGIVVCHDSSLKRLSGGEDTRDFREMTLAEIAQIRYWNINHTAQGRIPTLDQVLALIRQSTSQINALHYKGKYQDEEDLQRLVTALGQNTDILPRLLIFDVKPETALKLLRVFPEIQLAPSVAHPYDVERYNSSIANTLLAVDDAEELLTKGAYGKHPWVWLDEWDLTAKDGGQKKLYTREVFTRMRSAGAKISLVTPELHGTSPGLYGGESHPDAQTQEKLFARIREIISLEPDAICTDYPEQFTKPI